MVSSVPSYADLEIRLRGKQAGGYPVEMTLGGEQEFERGFLDPDILPWVPTADAAADGERLFLWLVADARIRSAWDTARGRRPRRRVRLRIDDDAPELHAIPWELLRDPRDQVPVDLAAGGDTPFSRYLSGQWQPGGPILGRPIKIVVAIANPSNLQADYNLEPVDVKKEFAALATAVTGLEAELVLVPQPCTLAALEAAVRGGCHVLHFIGHGIYRESHGASLYLADETGRVRPAGEEELAAMLARQLGDASIKNDDRLRLVFLSTCESATRSPADAFRGLAPRLVAAGVPAVLAMQEPVPVETARAFSASFYRQLLEHGLADLAANQARASLLTARLPGAAIPVLFMRLRNGQLLGSRGKILGEQAEGFWNTLLDNIAEGECTPFLGPGVNAGLLPDPVQVAQELAAGYGYPFRLTQSLPRVAQFVATLDNRRLRKEVIRSMVTGFKKSLGLPADPADRQSTVSQVAQAAGWPACTRSAMESEIHTLLADLGLKLYITTNFDNLMTLALCDRGHEARREMIPWHREASRDASRPHYDLTPPLSPANPPVVLHLFGTDDDPLSMVLTEDDYLDYLASISRDYEYLLPTSVQDRLASTTLLFLGYRLEDLDLKVILRGLLANLDLARWGMLHVAVQIESEEVDTGKQEDVIRFFQKYFANSRIDVYWGSAQQFVADLHARKQGVS